MNPTPYQDSLPPAHRPESWKTVRHTASSLARAPQAQISKTTCICICICMHVCQSVQYQTFLHSPAITYDGSEWIAAGE